MGKISPYTCCVKPDRIANTVFDIGLVFFLIQSKIMDGFDAVKCFKEKTGNINIIFNNPQHIR